MWIASATALATFISILPEPKKIFGIYSQPGKYFLLKAAFIYISIKLRKLQSMRKKTSETDTPQIKNLVENSCMISGICIPSNKITCTIGLQTVF